MRVGTDHEEHGVRVVALETLLPDFNALTFT